MKEVRQRELLDYLTIHKEAEITELEKHFNVSAMTIRRDLAQIEKTGSIMRVSGGAILVEPRGIEPSYLRRMDWNTQEKKRIAELACGLVQSGDVIFLDVGSTCIACARRLKNLDVTVVTNAYACVCELANGNNCDIIVLGGDFEKKELVCTGIRTYQEIEDYFFTRALIAVGGIDEEGLYDYNLRTIQIRRKVIGCAREVIVLADHTKFSRRPPIKIQGLDAVDKLVIADIDKVDSAVIQKITEQGIEIIC